MTNEKSLTKRVAVSAFWRIAKVGIDNVLRFGTFIVFARVLTPGDFGIFAICTFFVSVATIISKSGFPDALRRSKNPDAELKNTLFWANLGLSLIVSLLLAAASPLLAYWAGDRRIIGILVALSATLMTQPLGFVSLAMADREFKQRKIVTLQAIASVIGSVVAIICALSGLGLWSLVIQTLAISVLTDVFMFRMFPWVPAFQFSLPRLKETLGFSLNLLLAQLQSTLILRMQELIATTFLNLASVGLYRVGNRFMDLMTQAFISPLSGLGLISFSRLQDDQARFSKAYLKMVSTTSVVYCPVMLGFAGVAPDAVPLLFGAKWKTSVYVVQALSLLAPATVLGNFYGPALSARGRTDVVRKILTMQLIGTLVFSLIGVQFGVVGLALGYVARSYTTLPKQMSMLRDATGVQPEKGLAAALKPFACALAMALLVYAAHEPLMTVVPHAIPRLIVECLLGAAIYPALMLTLFRSFFLSHLADVRTIFSKSSLA